MGERLTVGVAARLSRYLQVLTQARKMGKDTDFLAGDVGLHEHQRDADPPRPVGVRQVRQAGVGYTTEALLNEIRKILRTQGQHNIALVGAGRLGRAIACSTIFAEHGINIAAVFDVDPDKVGGPLGGVVVSDFDSLSETVREKNIVVGVLAVPPERRSRPPTTWSAPASRSSSTTPRRCSTFPRTSRVHTSTRPSTSSTRSTST